MKQYFKSSPLGIIFAYLVGMLVGSLLGMLISALIGSAIFDINVSELIKYVSTDIKDLAFTSPNQIKAYNFMGAWVNFFQYFIMLVATAFYARDFLVTDFRDIRSDSNKRKRFLIMLAIAVLGVAFLIGFSELVNYLVSLVTNGKDQTSANQSTLENMINNGQSVIVFITVLFIAPIVEELVYRKAIFSLLSKQKMIVPLMVSSLAFALPHMLQGQENVWAWIILFIGYLVSGIVLGLIYHFSHKNIYASIFAHMLNNLVAFLMIVL